jgi:hypothetical protein
MEHRVRLLEAKADNMDGAADSFLHQAVISKLKGHHTMGEIHEHTARMLRRRAQKTRRVATNLMAECLEIQPIAESIGQHQDAVAV